MELSLFAISRVALMNLIVDGEPSERANEQTEKKPSDQYSIEAERGRERDLIVFPPSLFTFKSNINIAGAQEERERNANDLAIAFISMPIYHHHR